MGKHRYQARMDQEKLAKAEKEAWPWARIFVRRGARKAHLWGFRAGYEAAYVEMAAEKAKKAAKAAATRRDA